MGATFYSFLLVDVLLQVVLEGVLLGKRSPTDVALERMNPTVDPPVDNQIANARISLRTSFARDPNFRVHRSTVLL